MDREFLTGLLLFVGLPLTVVGLLIWFMVSSENAELAAFKQRCLQSGQTAQQCEVLAEVKESADGARAAAGMAIGYAAVSAGMNAGRRR